MLIRLLLLLVTLPLVELYLLLQFANITNAATTILVVIGTGLLGLFIARQQGWMAAWRFRQAMLQGRAPTTEIADTAMILVAAVLLILPGLLADALGLALLFPPSRRWIRRGLFRRLSGKLQVHAVYRSSGPPPDPDGVTRDGTTLEGTFRHTPADSPEEAAPQRIRRIEQR